jgi:polygalacturonase
VTRRLLLAGVLAVPVAAGAAARWELSSRWRRPATGAPGGPAFVPRSTSGEAVQEAVDAASRAGGGVVRLSSRTYVTDAPVLLKDDVMLQGAGPGSVLRAGPTFLDHPGPHGGHPLVTTSGAANVTIADLTADHSGNVLDADVPGRLREFLIDGRHSDNLVVTGVHTRNPFTYSIAVVGCSRFRVQGCRTSVRTVGRYDQLDGIHVLGSRYGDVVDNHVDQGGAGSDGDDGLVAHTIDDACHDVVFRNNTVRGGGHGAAMQLAAGDAPLSDIVIRNNYFYGSPRGLRTGYYAEGAVIRGVTVGGGSLAGNVFEDIGAPAVDFTAGPMRDTLVSYNTSIDAGGFRARPGPGTVLLHNETR